MRGQVLGVDRESGEGFIAGDDGQRYAFRPRDWSDQRGPAVGALVDFEVREERALRIFHQPSATGSAIAAGVQPTPALGDRNRLIAALIAFFFGIFGLHRFYLGRNGSALTMLILSITVIGLVVSMPWALIDTIRYLIMSDAEFAERYRRD